jgi:DNA primase
MSSRRPHPASQAVPILEAAQVLGLAVSGRKAQCFNATGHADGEDSNPSLVLFSDSGRFKCFACGVHGDVIDLVRAVRGVGFREAVAWLQYVTGDRPPGRNSSAPGKCRVRHPDDNDRLVYRRLQELSATPTPDSPAGGYLVRRGLDPFLAAAYGARELVDVACAWKALQSEFDAPQLAAAGLTTQNGHYLFARHPLLFFYLDVDEPVFVQARALTAGVTSKELRPAGLQCPLPFNVNVLSINSDRVFVCEGCIDTLSALQLGIDAVGVPGVQSFRDDWFSLFRGVGRVCVLFDNDDAGRQQGAELRSQFRLRGFRADAFHPAQGKDVNDCLLLFQQGDYR